MDAHHTIVIKVLHIKACVCVVGCVCLFSDVCQIRTGCGVIASHEPSIEQRTKNAINQSRCIQAVRVPHRIVPSLWC